MDERIKLFTTEDAAKEEISILNQLWPDRKFHVGKANLKVSYNETKLGRDDVSEDVRDVMEIGETLALNDMDIFDGYVVVMDTHLYKEAQCSMCADWVDPEQGATPVNDRAQPYWICNSCIDEDD